MNVTIIGGGTGTYVVTSGLKHNPNINLSKIVVVFDNGGSSGRLRDQFGFLPVGDIRQSLAAMAEENHHSWIRDLLLYRFEKGDIKGHNLGNLILTALQDMTGSTPQALEVAAKIFRLKGKVHPVTTTSTDLKIEYDSGEVVIGEDNLDDPLHGGKAIKSLSFTKPCQLYAQAKEAIVNSDYIIIGPGDVYASLAPNFLPDGAKAAFSQTKAKIIYIVNLMTRHTQTHNITAKGHVDIIESYLGRPLDIILINNGHLNPELIDTYAKYHEHPVIDDLKGDNRVVRADVASSVKVTQSKADVVPRSLMRHDQTKLIHILDSILK